MSLLAHGGTPGLIAEVSIGLLVGGAARGRLVQGAAPAGPG